jgi:hypothetical protein
MVVSTWKKIPKKGYRPGLGSQRSNAVLLSRVQSMKREIAKRKRTKSLPCFPSRTRLPPIDTREPFRFSPSQLQLATNQPPANAAQAPGKLCSLLGGGRGVRQETGKYLRFPGPEVTRRHRWGGRRAARRRTRTRARGQRRRTSA